MKLKKVLISIAPILIIVCVLLLLEAVVKVFDIKQYILPAPSQSFKWLFNNLDTSIMHFGRTVGTLLAGYSIGSCIGIVLAFLFTTSDLANRAVSPYVTLLVCMPQIILVPLLMLWFGFGVQVNIIASAMSCFAINMMNTMTGVQNVSEARRELMMSLKATKMQTFVMVLIPSALPSVFTGLKLGCIFAITGTIGSEMAGATKGLGSQLLMHSDNVMMAEAFAMIYLIMLMGVCVYNLLCFAERKAIRK